MIDAICKANGKFPLEPEERREYYEPEDSIPHWNGDECGRLKAGFLKLDIDDRDHKTEQLIDPIHDQPRSDAVKAWLDSKKIRYNLMITEHGKHFYFKVPADFPHNKNVANWYCALAIKAEWKFGGGTSKEHIPYKVNGVNRIWAMGDLFNENIDFIPKELWPLQKSKNKPFDLNMDNARNNGFSSYAFHLANKGYDVDEIVSVIHGVNDYVLETPLGLDELDTVLREGTLNKIGEIIGQRNQKNLSHMAVGDEIIEQFHLKAFHGSFYTYDKGVYTAFDKSRITEYMSDIYPSAKINFKREVEDYMKGKCRADMEETPVNLINVQNGFLLLDENGAVNLQPHSVDIVTFRQFHAAYDPGCTCPILNETLMKVFDGSSDQIELFDQMLGYLMMNHCHFDKCFFFIGDRNSGKSSILRMIINFCGDENVSTVKLADLTSHFGASPIVNKTANIVTEMPKTKILDSETFKAMTTGDSVSIERKYQESFSYRNMTKFIFGTNYYPDFSNDFEGIQRRVIIFPCDHTFKETDHDFNPFIDDELSTEQCMSALLNHALSGWNSLMKNKRFLSTRPSTKALNQFICQNDNVEQWLSETEGIPEILEREPISIMDSHNRPEGLYIDYKSFCIREQLTPVDQKDFSRRIGKKYGLSIKQKRTPGTNKKHSIFVKI